MAEKFFSEHLWKRFVEQPRHLDSWRWLKEVVERCSGFSGVPCSTLQKHNGNKVGSAPWCFEFVKEPQTTTPCFNDFFAQHHYTIAAFHLRFEFIEQPSLWSTSVEIRSLVGSIE